MEAQELDIESQQRIYKAAVNIGYIAKKNIIIMLCGSFIGIDNNSNYAT